VGYAHLGNRACSWLNHGSRLGPIWCALLLAACSGDDPVAPGALSSITPSSSSTGTSIVIGKASVLLPGTGQSAQLTAQILDAQGVPVAGTINWSSSAPDKVSVDASGLITAVAIGSAQIFAEAEGLLSAPTLTFVANPQSDALLVTDAQVVSVGSPLGLPPGVPPGVGTPYEVTLTGVSAPAAGTVILASETAPIAGKVVSTRQESAGIVVTVALAPLYELFTAYDVALRVDLSKFPAVGVPERGARMTPSAQWNATRGRPLGVAAVQADELAPFQAFDCDANIKPQLVSASIQLSLENNLTLVLEDRPGYSKHALMGSVALVGSAGLKLKAGFRATGECKAQAQIKLPVFGWASALAMPAVRVGLGASLEGEILLVQGELGVEGKVGVSPVVGWECGGATPACRSLETIRPLEDLKTKSRIPSENDMQVKVSGQFFVLAGLDLSLLAGAANAEMLEARLGPEQSFDLAIEKDQAARADYASSYDLKMKAVVEPGAALKKAIEMVIDDDATGVSFKAELTTDLSESPKGTLSLSKARIRPGEPVDFTVQLTTGLEYHLLGYNVTGLELYRKQEDELEFTPWKSMTQIASNGFTYRWVPEEADAGKYEFAAFVNTQLVTPLLEVAPSSIQPLEVACFSAAARFARTAAVPVCADTWTGTSTMIVKTPGLESVNITTRANITWTYDAASSVGGVIAYKASGNFHLAFNAGATGCTFSLSPSTFTIVDDPMAPARLFIFNNGVTPGMYSHLGSQRVDFTTTASCPGEQDVVTSFKGFLAPIASGGGPYSTDLIRLAGESDDGAIASTWDFRRP
jgi:hypothetical protein